MHTLLAQRESELRNSAKQAKEREERSCAEKGATLAQYEERVTAYKKECEKAEREGVLQLLEAASARVGVVAEALRVSAETNLQADALPSFKRDLELT